MTQPENLKLSESKYIITAVYQDGSEFETVRYSAEYMKKEVATLVSDDFCATFTVKQILL